jgi:SNF2 family DNA or RNA helicase
LAEFIYKTKPWPHQVKALEFLINRDFGALYTDMGTGKSKVMIDLIQNRAFKIVLVVCPNSICDVWVKQLSLHSDISNKNTLNLHSISSVNKVTKLKEFLKSECKEFEGDTKILICNYESVWRKPFSNFLIKQKIDCVICDESHRIKSPSSKVSLFLTRLGKVVPNRFLMTGTPLAENPCDIYAQYRFLQPKIFGTNFRDFCDRYQNIDPIKTAKVGFPILDDKNPYKNMDELKDKMFSCAFKIKSSIKLPSTTDIVEEFLLSPKCSKLYKEAKNEGVLEFKEGTMETSNVLALITRLQQITSGYIPIQLDDGSTKIKCIDKSKVEHLSLILDGISKHDPVVIFTKYKKEIKDIRKLCKLLEISYSELSGRKNTLNEWQEGKSRILVVQYQLGSEGIDLTRARYCIYYSLTHSLTLYEQSRKRVHRPGQNKPVVYYHMIGVIPKFKTIDQKIYEALKNKKNIVKSIMKNDLKI